MSDGHQVLIQISDAHITPEDGAQGPNGGTPGLVEQTDSFEALRRILELLSGFAPKPSLVVFSGDVADSGHPQAYQRVRALVEPAVRELGADLMWLPGNHDRIEEFREHLVDAGRSQEPWDQVVVLDGLRVIGLDSSVVERAHGELRDGQLTWLRKQLAAPAPRGTVLVVHHPPLANPVQPFIGSIDLQHPERLAEVVRGSDVRVILCGHVHFTSFATLAEIPVWVSPSTAYQADLAVPAGTLRAIADTAFTRVDVLPDAVHATEIHLAPEAAELYNWDLSG